jgi:hypothetical protein
MNRRCSGCGDLVRKISRKLCFSCSYGSYINKQHDMEDIENGFISDGKGVQDSKKQEG